MTERDRSPFVCTCYFRNDTGKRSADPRCRVHTKGDSVSNGPVANHIPEYLAIMAKAKADGEKRGDDPYDVLHEIQLEMRSLLSVEIKVYADPIRLAYSDPEVTLTELHAMNAAMMEYIEKMRTEFRERAGHNRSAAELVELARDRRLALDDLAGNREAGAAKGDQQ